MVFVGDFSEYEVVVVRATVIECEKSGNTVVASRWSVSFLLSTQTPSPNIRPFDNISVYQGLVGSWAPSFLHRNFCDSARASYLFPPLMRDSSHSASPRTRWL